MEAKSRKVKKSAGQEDVRPHPNENTKNQVRDRFGTFEGHKLRMEVDCPDEIRDTSDRTKVMTDTSTRTGNNTAIDFENVTVMRRRYQMKI